MNRASLLAAYLRQQQELAMPDWVFGPGPAARSSLQSIIVGADAGRTMPRQAKDPYAKLARLAPLHAAKKKQAPSVPGTQTGSLTFKQKRAVFKELYAARCDRCALARTRTTFVFGAGNVDAPLVIIGEAPGAEEDAQGLPFVGAAGGLLTDLLEAVALDRKKDVFITNVLKCRPPDNRTPDAAEVIACLPLLQRQVEVIAPRLLLLVGRIAAHALLGSTESIGKLRGRVHEYRGIPAVVTYHPAALLRTAEYRGPAEDDFRTVARLLKEGGHHGAS
jgi:uracil-DNA glycosylase family 4